MDLSFDQLEEIIATSRVVYSDSYSDGASYGSSYCSSSAENSPVHSGPGAVPRRRRPSKTVMNDRDKGIYNSLGSSSSCSGKLTYTELGLQKGWQKRGIMWKSGPRPSWYSRWMQRIFVLKDNFLYYFGTNHELREAPVLGAIFLKNAVIEKTSLPFAKKVLKITPPVPRRRGWDENDESCVFHIRFKTEEGRNEWYEELQQVSFSHQFPSEKEPLLTGSMRFTSDILTRHNS